jgi:hypothetical protein
VNRENRQANIHRHNRMLRSQTDAARQTDNQRNDQPGSAEGNRGANQRFQRRIGPAWPD